MQRKEFDTSINPIRDFLVILTTYEDCFVQRIIIFCLHMIVYFSTELTFFYCFFGIIINFLNIQAAPHILRFHQRKLFA